jgi:hypothetical protein
MQVRSVRGQDDKASLVHRILLLLGRCVSETNWLNKLLIKGAQAFPTNPEGKTGVERPEVAITAPISVASGTRTDEQMKAHAINGATEGNSFYRFSRDIAASAAPASR